MGKLAAVYVRETLSITLFILVKSEGIGVSCTSPSVGL